MPVKPYSIKVRKLEEGTETHFRYHSLDEVEHDFYQEVSIQAKYRVKVAGTTIIELWHHSEKKNAVVVDSNINAEAP